MSLLRFNFSSIDFKVVSICGCLRQRGRPGFSRVFDKDPALYQEMGHIRSDSGLAGVLLDTVIVWRCFKKLGGGASSSRGS